MNKLDNFFIILLLTMPVLAQISCTGIKNDSSPQQSIQPITSLDQFNNIIENSDNQLIAFDLFADWCMPCHVLAPILDEIARENSSKLVVYSIDTDIFPQITEAFGATGIPFVVFVKNQKAIYALMGVQPKESYQKVIETYADTSSGNEIKPEQKKIEGIRILKQKENPITIHEIVFTRF